MEIPLDERRIIIRERLRLLSWGYKISGIIGILCASILIIHCIVFTSLSFIPASAWDHPSHATTPSMKGKATPPPPAVPGPPLILFRILAVIIGFFMVCGWTLGGLTYYAGHCLALRKHRTFVMVMASINCLWIPFGTLLGVCTFITVGNRDAEAEFPQLSPPPL